VATTEAKQPALRTFESIRADGRRGSRWYCWLARAGLVAKGVSYGLVGVLAIDLAVSGGGKATSRQGALHSLAGSTLGKALLVLLAAGFAAYASWRLIQAIAERADGDEAEDRAKTWGKRAGYLGRAAIYAGLTWSTIAIVAGAGGGQSQNQKAHRTTATAFDLPAGRWLVLIAGVTLAGVGLWNLYRGLARKFEDKWKTGEMGRRQRCWGSRIGLAGHAARFVVFGLIGVFVAKAAIDYDPKEAIGLDGALQKLAHAAYGPWLLGVTAAGLVCYGAFCLVDARFRDVSTG